jgi:hypothetical protein
VWPMRKCQARPSYSLVWAIEKFTGAGAITGELNIRPIVLLEPAFKLLEAIIPIAALPRT